MNYAVSWIICDSVANCCKSRQVMQVKASDASQVKASDANCCKSRQVMQVKASDASQGK